MSANATVLDVPKGERKSWVCWEEEKAPDVVIELLSESTASVDKSEKKRIYETKMHVPEYSWYDPFKPEDWAGFRLQGGKYAEMSPNQQGQLVSRVLDLVLMRWQGRFKDVETTWLRWAYPDGTILLIAAEQERIRAEQAEAQVRQIALNLLKTGMNLAQVAQITGLSIDQLQASLQ